MIVTIVKPLLQVELYMNYLILNMVHAFIFQEPRAVNWMLPESRDETPESDWFNILVLHQNRCGRM